MKIIKFENKYRDDLIFMILEAKNALGTVPSLNEDLLDIQKNYFDKGNMFWVAVDENGRVIGNVGFNTDDVNGATLHRLFVKYNLKHRGIGTALLKTTGAYIKQIGIETIYVNLEQGDELFEYRNFYKKHGYVEYSPNKMKKTVNL